MEWNKTKSRVKTEVRDGLKELVELYAIDLVVAYSMERILFGKRV